VAASWQWNGQSERKIFSPKLTYLKSAHSSKKGGLARISLERTKVSEAARKCGALREEAAWKKRRECVVKSSESMPGGARKSVSGAH